MGRSSSSRGSSSRPAPAPARAPPPAARSAPPPARQAPAPAPAPAPMQSSSGGGMLSGLGSTMAQGFAFGTGSALAREAVGSIFGGSSAPAPAAAPAAAPAPTPAATMTPSACEYDQKAFQACLQQNPTNAGNCDHYYQALQACQSRM